MRFTSWTGVILNSLSILALFGSLIYVDNRLSQKIKTLEGQLENQAIVICDITKQNTDRDRVIINNDFVLRQIVALIQEAAEEQERREQDGKKISKQIHGTQSNGSSVSNRYSL